MARTRRSTGRRSGRRRRGGLSLPSFSLPPISPDVGRSIIGIALLVLGAVTLIAFGLPGQGKLTDWWRDSVVPFFGAGRWMLPLLLIAAGWYVEWGPGKEPGSGWRLTLAGVAISYVGLLGAIQATELAQMGRIGRFVETVLTPLLTRPGAVVVLLGVAAGGVLLAFNLQLKELLRPVTGTARWVGSTAAASMRREPGEERDPSSDDDETEEAPRGRKLRLAVGPGSSGGQTGIWGNGDDEEDEEEEEDEELPIPSAVPSTAPASATFAPARDGRSLAATLVAERAIDDVTDARDSPRTRERRDYILPPLTLLDDVEMPAAPGGEEIVHRRNEEIIVRKLAGFNIPAQIVARNAGPVVTQYEVQPAPDIKVSRIEALADDLAMALAARSLRIEAPIPGKSAVGIEIPNKEFNIVALRRILEEVDFTASGSSLTFALGRDVAGKAQAVDLAKMPHLLIAGATGSGKSVMVNALITSLLCQASPDDVRMILVDLKRVELAAYNGLPQLLVPVVTEPERAKAALKWTVNEMEGRYRRFAGAAVRNIRGYNDSRVDPADRLPYIVIVVDELADLMMREGRNIEDPIVRLAQKARATGIHLVLATQRPSVNVVTGLIKANFPSRIAFAMASQIDSRTILDAPGAEDLIGRGDMLYQPSDLPRPMRLQGVFVSDAEIGRVTGHWRDQIEDPHYDLAIIESDEDGTATRDDLADADADRLLPDAVEVIREYDRASASLLQRRLKIGYARAARIVDQLEERGYIGAFDGSNARAVLRTDGADGGGGADEDDAE
jgi:DNA segregation ATPase FtsK/SpoIIIE-like protein